MALTGFTCFPLLPQGTEDEIWLHVVDNAQQHLLNDIGKAHFFTLYRNNSCYDPANECQPHEKIAKSIPEDEDLYVRDEDPSGWNQFRFAAPRKDPWSSGSWAPDQSYEEVVVEQGGPDNDGDVSDSDSDASWIDPEAPPEEGRRIQTITQGEFDGETHLLPIAAARDLVVFRPLYHFQAPWALPALPQFDSVNIGLEFNPVFGYPADNTQRYGLEEEGRYGPQAVYVTDSQPCAPLEWITIMCQRVYHGCNFPRVWRNHPERKVWFIDHRIRLQDGALIDEQHRGRPRRVFRDACYYYVKVKEQDDDWEYGIPHDGVEVHKFAEQLNAIVDRMQEVGTPTPMDESVIGVLARVSINEVKIIASDDEPVGSAQDAAEPTIFRGRVRRPFPLLRRPSLSMESSGRL